MSDGAPVPDPLAFTLDALEAKGALVESVSGGEDEAGHALVLLPDEVARGLGVAEELRLVRSAREGDGVTVPCGLGTPLLEALVAEHRDRVARATLRLDLDAPRATHARALGERFVVRNGLSELKEVLPAEGRYLRVTFRWVAEADDRAEGTFTLALSVNDGAEPDASFAAALDPESAAIVEDRFEGERHGWGNDVVTRALAARAAREVDAAVAPVRAAVERRHRRDHERIAEYFSGLAAELSGTRRRLSPEAVAARVEQYAAERDAKLAGLAGRFTLRVTTSPLAVARVEAPTLRLTLRLRRRKAERELRVALPAGSAALDRPRCEGCDGSTDRPALCDDALHLLCERCAPSAQGRLKCPACGAR